MKIKSHKYVHIAVVKIYIDSCIPVKSSEYNQYLKYN